ncbi:hypothetical protein M426DRAFT_322795 [Hypoxylon sp. CI-4A]|nr:hypothetical protein M426DRAFT_322795 [Hypoxylon sp. CI-4A]
MPDSKLLTGHAAWHEVILRQKYNDPLKLKDSLNNLYGEGRYKVKTRANRYILQVPEPMQQAQIAELEAAIRFHYNA